MLDKLFGENGILSENGKNYYKHEIEHNEKRKLKKKKRIEFFSKLKKAFLPSLVTAFGIAFALNGLNAIAHGNTLINVIGMSLIEAPFAIPVGFIGYKIFQSVKENIDKKITIENKKIEEFAELQEEKKRTQELLNTQEIGHEKVQTDVQKTIDYETIIRNSRMNNNLYKNIDNEEFIQNIMNDGNSNTQQETQGQQRVRRR